MERPCLSSCDCHGNLCDTARGICTQHILNLQQDVEGGDSSTSFVVIGLIVIVVILLSVATFVLVRKFRNAEISVKVEDVADQEQI